MNPAAARRAPTASVVICCYDDGRFNDVREATLSALAQEPPPHEIILVVDHNPALEARLRAEFPGVVVTANRQAQGLSGARNTGVAIAGGEAIMFLDDDAALADGALAGLCSLLADERVLGVGAQIEPVWLGATPQWFPREFLWVVGCSYAGLKPGRVRNLIGAAMCVRRSVFDKVGGFTHGLGRDRTRLPLGCEETEFCIRAAAAFPGAGFVHDDRSVCLHKAPAKRATWRYFVTRCYAEGLSKAHVSALMGSGSALSSERSYVSQTLRDGVLKGIAEAARGRGGALLNVAAIGLGLGATIFGYALARSQFALRGLQAPDGSPGQALTGRAGRR